MSNFASNENLNVRVYIDEDNNALYITNNFFYDGKVIYPDAVIRVNYPHIFERLFAKNLNVDSVICHFTLDFATKQVNVTDSVHQIKNIRTIKVVNSILLSLSKRAIKLAMEVNNIDN